MLAVTLGLLLGLAIGTASLGAMIVCRRRRRSVDLFVCLVVQPGGSNDLECLNVYFYCLMVGWVDGGTDGLTDGRREGRTDGRTDERTDGRTDGRTYGRTD